MSRGTRQEAKRNWSRVAGLKDWGEENDMTREKTKKMTMRLRSYISYMKNI